MSNGHMKIGNAFWLGIIIIFLASFSPLSSLAETSGAGGTASAQEGMTPERFREIVAKPGDNVPLDSNLANVPFWTHAAISNVTTNADSKVVVDNMALTARTVGGKYIVFTIYSELYHQTTSTIVAYDKAASAIKNYALYNSSQGGDTVIEGTIIYDYAKKTYTIFAEYGDGFKEITHGSYTAQADVAHTVIYKDNTLILSREVTTRPTSQ